MSEAKTPYKTVLELDTRHTIGVTVEPGMDMKIRMHLHDIMNDDKDFHDTALGPRTTMLRPQTRSTTTYIAIGPTTLGLVLLHPTRQPFTILTTRKGHC